MHKWESEDEIHEGLRRLTEEMRRLREELQNSASSRYRRAPALPTEDERRLRSIAPDEKHAEKDDDDPSRG